jgi:hypothetical protein
MGQFEDDRYLSRLQTLLAQYPPSQVTCLPTVDLIDEQRMFQILAEKNKLSDKTKKVLTLTQAKMEYLIPNKEMFETTKTLDLLREDGYFNDKKGNLQWPDAFEQIFNEGARASFAMIRLFD